ncbi:MAG: hypothetical protein H6571_22050 [Lewinellaceae bacterium]|jgi:hypothetical protein|nr:hypothetical protein [Lewinellaceae bacterium]
MKVRLILFSLVSLVFGFTANVQAQEIDTIGQIQALSQKIDSYRPGTSGFLLRGYAHSGLQVTEEKFSFVGGSFNPLFIYKQSDKLLFESELELELVGGEVEFGVEYANMSYILNKSLTVRAGKFLVPFGIFVPNLHPAWINKFPGGPLGAGHDGIIPTNDIGIELRGGSYLGNLKLNYSIYAVNGSQLNDGVEEPEEAGVLHHAIFPDNNKGKTIGGRLGIFPMSNSSLELGFSGMYGKVGAAGTKLEDVNALHFAFDMSYVTMISSLSSVLDFKAQYSSVKVDDAEYPDHENPGEFITFDNSSSTWFAQLSLRPALVDNNFIRNIEFAGRYSTLITPEGSEWEVDQTQLDLGINYWFDWRTVLKFSYRISGSAEAAHDEPDVPDVHGEEVTGNVFFIHWAIGF